MIQAYANIEDPIENVGFEVMHAYYGDPAKFNITASSGTRIHIFTVLGDSNPGSVKY